MSRFDDVDYDYVVPESFWEHNLKRALASKRGQKALREMREALLALPEKRLIAGALCEATLEDDDTLTHPQFCAVGAFAFYKRTRAGENPQEVLEHLSRYEDMGEPYDTATEGQRQGLAWTLAWHLAQLNDDLLKYATPEQRYEQYLAWVDSQILPVGRARGDTTP